MKLKSIFIDFCRSIYWLVFQHVSTLTFSVEYICISSDFVKYSNRVCIKSFYFTIYSYFVLNTCCCFISCHGVFCICNDFVYFFVSLFSVLLHRLKRISMKHAWCDHSDEWTTTKIPINYIHYLWIDKMFSVCILIFFFIFHWLC